MYNTSRHDHFLRLKPLKMAPYFLKPIDLRRKSVQKLPAIPTPHHRSPHKLLSSLELPETQAHAVLGVDVDYNNILRL